MVRESVIGNPFKWKGNLNFSCQVMVVATGAAIPLSTALGSVTAGLALLFWILSGNFSEKFQAVKNNKVIVVSMFLFMLMAIAVVYSSAPVDEALRGLRKYLLFLLALVVATTVSSEEKWRRWGVWAFLFGMLLTLVFSFTDSFGLTHIGEGPASGHAVFVGQITQNIFMAFAVYLLLHLFVRHVKYRWMIALAIILALYNMLFLAMGRTGYVVLAFLLVLFSIQRVVASRGLNIKWLFLGGMAGVLITSMIFAAAYQTSDVFKYRINMASEGFSMFQTGNSSSSTGLRLEFYANSIDLIMKKPWFGYGMGSLSSEYKKMAEQKGLVGDHVTRNPHNEYIVIAFQLGIVGLVIFLYLFFVQWRASLILPCYEMFIAQGFIVVIMVGSLLNSLLLDHVTGLFFGFFTGLLFSGINGSSNAPIVSSNVSD